MCERNVRICTNRQRRWWVVAEMARDKFPAVLLRDGRQNLMKETDLQGKLRGCDKGISRRYRSGTGQSVLWKTGTQSSRHGAGHNSATPQFQAYASPLPDFIANLLRLCNSCDRGLDRTDVVGSHRTWRHTEGNSLVFDDAGTHLLVSTRSIRARDAIAVCYPVRFAGAMSEPLCNWAYCS
jgi:hypothetical protein